MKVKIDNRDVLYSGSCVSINDESLLFEFAPDFKICVRFENDDGKKKYISYEVVDNVLVMKLFNFSRGIGSATRESLHMGTLNGQDVYLNFTHYYLGDEQHHTRVFHYSFISGARS